MNKKLIPSEMRRVLMIEVIQGHPGVPPLMFHLNQHYKRCEQILVWLIENKIIGQKLIDFIKENDNSPLRAFSLILTKIHKDKEKRKIILGRDFIS